MAKNRYSVKFSATFFKQLESIIKYISFDLNNKSAAEKLYKKIVDEIHFMGTLQKSTKSYFLAVSP